MKEFTIPLEKVTPVEEGETAPGTETPTPTPTPAGPPERVTVTVIDFGLRLNVRAGPSTDYDIVAKAVAGVTFNGIGRTESGGPFEELPVEGEMKMEEEMEMDSEMEKETESDG